MGHLMPQQRADGPNSDANPHQIEDSTISACPVVSGSTSKLLRCSFFSHAKDNSPRLFHGNEDTLRTILRRTFTPRPGAPGGDAKRSMPAISGAFYPPGVTRARDAVAGVSLWIADFDNATEESIPGEFYTDPRTGEPTKRPKTRKVPIADPVTMEEVIAALRSAGVASMGWTTWSCSPAWPKFRVVVFLAAPVPLDLWERFAEAALVRLGLEPFRRGLDVPVLRNPAALAFLPGSPDPDSIRKFETGGRCLFIPFGGIPSSLPPTLAPWQADIVEQRKVERASGDQWWMAYRIHGRPVDFGTVDLAAILESRGVKVGSPKPFKNGTKRRAHCPWAGEHTGGVDDDSAVIIQTPCSWPSFKCAHSGHAHMGLRDLIEWAWGTP